MRDKYAMFHGKKAKRKIAHAFHVPKELIFLGHVEQIVYSCNKNNGGGNGKKNYFVHDTVSRPMLCMDERGKGALYIIGDKIKVTEAGIEN